jgi:hypothetical protein
MGKYYCCTLRVSLSTRHLTCVECMNIWKVAQGENMKPREREKKKKKKKKDFHLEGNTRRETTKVWIF